MLHVLSALFAELDRRSVRYCHWKSNVVLAQTLEGRTDVDLLLDDGQRPQFEAALHDLGIRACRRLDEPNHPPYHYFLAFDEPTGALTLLDIYDDLVTGGSLLKNFRLPLKAMVFENLDRSGAVPVPERACELVLFVVRKMIESASGLEQALLMREFEGIQRELDWLVSSETLDRSDELLATYLPQLEPALFRESIDALRSRAAMQTRWRLGRQVERSLVKSRRHGAVLAEAMRGKRFGRMVFDKYIAKRKTLRLAGAGTVIAVIGPDASGKSTVVSELTKWLGGELAVTTVHAGKPPPTLFTLAPNVLLPLARSLFPRHRSSAVEAAGSLSAEGSRSRLGVYLHVARSLGIAYDRWRLLRRCNRLAAKGVVVVVDRYPTPEPGATDSAILNPEELKSYGYPIAARLARLEHRLYRAIPSPSIALLLRVPIDLALQRNRSRGKAGGPDPDDYVRHRHEKVLSVHLQGTEVVEISTGRPLAETLDDVRRAVWRAL